MVDFSKLERQMADLGLDGLMTTDPKNGFYLTGYMDPEIWLRDVQDLTTLIPVVSPPDRSFIVGTQIEGTGFPGPAYYCEMVLEKRLEMVADEIGRRGLSRSRFGIDMDYTPVSVFTMLRELLPDAEFVPADSMLCKVRSVKSREELEQVEGAVNVAEAAFLDVLDMVREGTLISDLLREWGQAVIARGGYPVAGLPFDFITQSVMRVQQVYARPSRYLDRLPSRLETGCMTRVDLSVCHNGYLSDQKIVICVGEPAPEAMAVYQEHRSRQAFMKAFMKAFIKPGMTKRQVYEACLDNFEHLDEYGFWIHGVGLDVHEEPRIGTLLPSSVGVKEEVTFEVGQVLALEPSWLVEDLYVLREEGFERLGTLPQKVFGAM